jgi:hypothetical protein
MSPEQIISIIKNSSAVDGRKRGTRGIPRHEAVSVVEEKHLTRFA